MKVAIGKIADSADALKELGKLQLVAKSSLRIARIIRTVQPELELHDAQRIACAKQYGTLDEAKNLYMFKPDAAQKFADEMTELGKTEIEIAIEKLTIADLEGAKVSPLMLVALDWLIEE